MKIYLDDERAPPEGWILARSVPVLCHLLQTHQVTHLSLDHDLGEDEMTGYDFMRWLEAQVFSGTIKEIPEITFHTANPTGRKNMELALANIHKMMSQC
jgi:hypothetical protein